MIWVTIGFLMYSCKVFHILKQKVLCFCTQPSCGLKVDHLDSLECLVVREKLQTEELCCRWWQYVYTFNNILFWLQHQHNSWERERAMGNVNSTEKWILIIRPIVQCFKNLFPLFLLQLPKPFLLLQLPLCSHFLSHLLVAHQ